MSTTAPSDLRTMPSSRMRPACSSARARRHAASSAHSASHSLRWAAVGGQLVTVAVVFNLALLGVFKYYDFFVESFNELFGTSIPLADIVLPVGISFFTFQAISYVVDVYRHDTSPAPLLDFAVYLSFFPQLVAAHPGFVGGCFLGEVFGLPAKRGPFRARG